MHSRKSRAVVGADASSKESSGWTTVRKQCFTPLELAQREFERAKRMKCKSRKTSICKFHKQHRCRKGPRCVFAHSAVEALAKRAWWKKFKHSKVKAAYEHLVAIKKALRKPKKQRKLVLKSLTLYPDSRIKMMKKEHWEKKQRKMKAEEKLGDGKKLTWKQFAALEKVFKPKPKIRKLWKQAGPQDCDFKALCVVTVKRTTMTSWVTMAKKAPPAPTGEDLEAEKKQKAEVEATKIALAERRKKALHNLEKDMIFESREEMEDYYNTDDYQEEEEEKLAEDWEDDYSNFETADASYYELRR